MWGRVVTLTVTIQMYFITDSSVSWMPKHMTNVPAWVPWEIHSDVVISMWDTY